MASPLPPWLTEAQAMLARLEPYLTVAQASHLKSRLAKWQTKTIIQASGQKTAPISANLPILVMRPRSLPQTVDPFYFSLDHIKTV